MKVMKIEVIEKSTGKIVWTEIHYTNTTLFKALEQLKENNFNPDYFHFKLKKA
ncbi:hypothetical protein J7E79_02885 [Bacillus sp. ISL-40]|uniref:hypothetical protein n=1 Tax=unclassified Bacillus (in: firmicutes) TaxID=185979 RepID=UPI001BEA2656|nr:MULTISPECIES: hypothetical protein [unclassified Bacillus (in: firmicutes)]MBT2696382.1 hypothetical protein [Bacillus sp. ISL-40]MBT2743231.1 hypothetical protein [Bacillus sp. ISL-77]